MRRLAALLCLVGFTAWLALGPGEAVAKPGNISSRVRLVYEQRETIPPCEFTSPQLNAALNAVDSYGLEYFADYIAAIQTALTLRAAGACSKSTATGAHNQPAHIPPEAPLPASLTSATGSDFPAPILLLGILGLVLVGAASLLTLGRRTDWPAEWPDRWHHAAAEARYRAQGAWDAMLDRWRR